MKSTITTSRKLVFMLVPALVFNLAGWAQTPVDTKASTETVSTDGPVGTQYSAVQGILDLSGLTYAEAKAVAPNLPDPNKDGSKGSFKLWALSYPAEFDAFRNNDKVNGAHFDWHSLGVDVAGQTYVFYDDIFDMIKYKGITPEGMAANAPHFPAVENVSDEREKGALFSRAKIAWMANYPAEWAYIRDFGNYVPTDSTRFKPIEYPKGTPQNFLEYTLEGIDMPVFIDTGNPVEDKKSFDLRTQQWIYITSPAKYRAVYGEPEDPGKYINNLPNGVVTYEEFRKYLYDTLTPELKARVVIQADGSYTVLPANKN